MSCAAKKTPPPPLVGAGKYAVDLIVCARTGLYFFSSCFRRRRTRVFVFVCVGDDPCITHETYPRRRRTERNRLRRRVRLSGRCGGGRGMKLLNYGRDALRGVPAGCGEGYIVVVYSYTRVIDVSHGRADKLKTRVTYIYSF